MIRTLALTATLVFSVPALAMPIVITHTGANDPTTEGWGTSIGGTVITPGPVFNDLGLGVDAWQVDDTFTASVGSNFHNYTRLFNATEADLITNTQGWSFEMDVRMLRSNDATDFSVAGEVSTETTRFAFGLGTSSDGTLLFELPLTGDNISAGVNGVNQYNNIRLDFEVATQTVDLFVNDTLIVDDWVGDNRGLVGFLGPHVRFGAAHSSQVGGANYAAVSFSSLPAPVSEPHTALLLVGLPLLVAMRARRRRAS